MNKHNYKKLKSDPLRLAKERLYKANWKRQHRFKHLFRYLSGEFFHRNKIRILPYEFFGIAKRQKLICPLTGRQLTKEVMSIDHKIPVSQGGTHEISNLQFVHVHANYAKRNLPQDEFIKLCKEVARFHK